MILRGLTQNIIVILFVIFCDVPCFQQTSRREPFKKTKAPPPPNISTRTVRKFHGPPIHPSDYSSKQTSVRYFICISKPKSLSLSHSLYIYLSHSLYIYLSLTLSLYLSVSLSLYIYISHSIYISLSLSLSHSLSLSLYLSVSLSLLELYS